MTDLINLMNDLLWGSILVYLLVGVGAVSYTHLTLPTRDDV